MTRIFWLGTVPVVTALLFLAIVHHYSSHATLWRFSFSVIGYDATTALWRRILEFDTAATQHSAAHALGEALYLSGGSIASCPANFSYGCAHQFFGSYINDAGEVGVEEIAELCKKESAATRLSCEHGIGHGYVFHFGYEREDLSRALASCTSAGFESAIGGCYGGVFMEYNIRTMLGEAQTLRTQKNYFEPCDSLFLKERNACFFWLPQLWHKMYDSDDGVIGFMFTRCAQLTSSIDRHYCRMGVGNRILWLSNMDLEASRALCDAAPSWDERMSCRSAYASEIAPSNDSRHIDLRCANLQDSEALKCHSWHFDVIE